MKGTTQNPRQCKTIGLVCAAIAALSTGAAANESVPSFNFYGLPGLIDMPTGEVAPDATLSGTYSSFGSNTRATLHFQITPRLSGAFRYSAISDFNHPASVAGVYYDRSFDLRYQLLTEGTLRPSVVVGLQDFIGTGLYGGEYVVATKTIAPGLKVTGGLGWGRLGSHNPFSSIGNRPTEILGEGGLPTYDRWFRGDVAAFGGLSYAPSERLQFSVEYSSDAYALETADGGFNRKSSINYGVDYMFKSGTQVSLYYAYGNEIGAQVSFHTNPRKASAPGGAEKAPVPVLARSSGAAYDLGWTTQEGTRDSVRATLATIFAKDGLVLEGLTLEPKKAVVRLRNPNYGLTPQALGRAARGMTRALPASVETFVIVPVENGAPMSAVTFLRTDLERLENAAADEMLARTVITDGFGLAPKADKGIYPRFSWSLAPFMSLSFFDPDNPVRADAGLRLSGDFHLTPNVVVSGSVTKKLVGDLDQIARASNSKLPIVRTDFGRYAAEGDPAIEHLTLAHYGRLGPQLYSRVTLGYLEQMYAGASAEVLWKPVGSRLALGAEVNYVRLRDYDQMFGLQSNDTRTGTIPDLNGHVSAYYDFGNGFHGQLDVGRFLAGDLGATVTLDREFANGWRVGAYATVTDTPFEDFGEGSFDKGIRISIPVSWALGSPNRTRNDLVIQSLTRDGGARLNVNGRLYETVREYHEPEIAKSWGKFWR